MPDTPFDLVAFIMAYESGQLSYDAIVEGFQHLIDSGKVYHLQGSYGRMADSLIRSGHCAPHPTPTKCGNPLKSP